MVVGLLITSGLTIYGSVKVAESEAERVAKGDKIQMAKIQDNGFINVKNVSSKIVNLGISLDLTRLFVEINVAVTNLQSWSTVYVTSTAHLFNPSKVWEHSDTQTEYYAQSVRRATMSPMSPMGDLDSKTIYRQTHDG